MLIKEKEILYINVLVENAVGLIPNFWPMRSFIHHNPLHGFENMHFEDAVKKAHKLFSAKKFLSREVYQEFFNEGKISKDDLAVEIERFLQSKEYQNPLLAEMFFKLVTRSHECYLYDDIKLNSNVYVQEIASKLQENLHINSEDFHKNIIKNLAKDKTIYDSVDELFGTHIGAQLNDIMAQASMRFLGEGQAVWNLPNRENGMFLSWKEVILQDKIFYNENHRISRLLKQTDTAEDIIYWVLMDLKIPRILWEDYFTLELTKLHGWTGFIKWRSTSGGKYQKKYPVFLEEFLAIRLYYSYMLLKGIEPRIGFFPNMEEIIDYVTNKKENALFRYDYFGGKLLVNYFERAELGIRSGSFNPAVYEEYILEKKQDMVARRAEHLYRFLSLSLNDAHIKSLSAIALYEIYTVVLSFEEEEGFILQKAMERFYMYTLMEQTVAHMPLVKERKKPDAQLFFCIDIRSERIRRYIEKTGNYETFGLAGFFGIPLKLIDIKNRCESDLCPAMAKPKNIVYSFFEPQEKKNSIGLQHLLKKVMHDLKYNVLTPYITVEVVGVIFGFDFFGKSLFPSSYMPLREEIFSTDDMGGDLRIERYSEQEANEAITQIQKEIIKNVIQERFNLVAKNQDQAMVEEILKLSLSSDDLIKENQDGVSMEPVTALGHLLHLMMTEEQALITTLRTEYKISAKYMRQQKAKMAKVGFGFKEQLSYVENAFKSVGLTENFADIVVFCGHESKSENNPYESALDCGACGGNSSSTNARVLAYMANKPLIRERLVNRGIVIEDSTLFVAGIHNTASDKITLYDTDIPPSHVAILNELQCDLQKASIETAYERVRQLPFGKDKSKSGAVKLATKNTMDWSQPRPEWGLSGNHSFLIGKRESSKEMNLEGKTFLHSYDYTKDATGNILEIILSGPLVVGEWINMEHFFSSMDNETYGSQSKVYHNVVGKLGVIFGNMSDLKVGLPSQTVHHKGKPYHEPIRLITMIEAPFETHRRSIDKIHKISELVYNEWIKIIFMDREKLLFYYYCGYTKDWITIPFSLLKKEIKND